MKSHLVAIAELSTVDREAMYGLLSTHFAGVKRAVFDADLNTKNWVILLKDERSQMLKGFSTILMYETGFAGEELTVVYSGDTIMDPSAWSSSALSRAWIASVNQLRRKYPRGKLYWLLISSGYRTYRFLPTFWQEFYPRYDVLTSPTMARLMQFLAQRQFGDFYDATTGIVRFPYPQQLKGQLQGIPEERCKDPHIDFFAAKNPHHDQGDELVCLAEITETNLTPAGRLMWFAMLEPAALV